MADQPDPGTPDPGQGPPSPGPPWPVYPARPGPGQVVPSVPYPRLPPRSREQAWTWALLCLIQAGIYVAQIVVFFLVMWGVYGDGNLTAADDQSAGQWTLIFGMIAAAVAAWAGIFAWRSGPRALAIGEFVLIAAILALSGYGAADLMLTR
jgi:hypothetical protein